MGKLKSNSEWQLEVSELVGNEYSFLEGYVNAKTKIKVRHNDCGYVYEVCPDKFRVGRRCPKCVGKYKRTNQDFLEWAKDTVGDEYSFLTPYKNLKTPIETIHNVCGHTYQMNPSHFIHGGKRCPKCAGNMKIDEEEFLERVYNLWGDEYEIVGKFVGYRDKITVKHVPCGKVYDVPALSLTKHRSCTCYTRSLGEMEVAKTLDLLKVEYEEEWRIGNRLRADFYLPKYRAIIEFDGKQHYEPRESFGGHTEFKKLVFRDSVKDHYCEYMDIPILRIPYWEYKNVQQLIEDFIIVLDKRRELSAFY